jgi:hypothetical protein
MTDNFKRTVKGMVERDAVVGNEIGFLRKPDLTEIVRPMPRISQ